MPAQMRLVGLLARRIDDQHQVVALVRHHQVVEHAARGIGEHRVALPARGEPEHVAGHQRFERARCVLDASGSRTQRDLAHVRDVEQAGGGAGVQMLLDDAGRDTAPACRSRRTAPCARRAARAGRKAACA